MTGSFASLQILYNNWVAGLKKNLNLKVLIEGFYYPGDSSFNISDTVRVYLARSISPYNLIDSSTAVLDLDGNDTLKFLNAPAGTYYIVIKHRNSIETWSKSGGEVFTTIGINNYNFTTAISQAFGNNLKLKGTNVSNNRYCIFSADVNQDGVVDAADLSSIDNDAHNFLTGYVNTDVNGDSFVDASDLSISDNNAFNFVGRIRP